MSNQAAWLMKAKTAPLEVKEAPMPVAGKGQVVIKNHALAVNPVDWKIQDYGAFVKNYPFICGTDVAGEVVEVGEGVTHVKKGDRVIGHAFSLLSGDSADGGFQLYTRCNGIVTQKIPSSMSFNSGAVLPLAISTAAASLFKKEAIGLPLPTAETRPSQTGTSVLVWGGASSIGAVAIQLAAGAGVKVVTVASKHNLEKVKALGASAAFDYRSPGVADEIIAALEGTKFAGICDCIGTPDAIKAWSPVYKKLGGRYGTVLPAEGLPEGIEGTGIFAPAVGTSDSYIGEAVWQKWVPAALQDGALKAVPEPIVIPGGLESVQEGYNQQKRGVSFGKIVIQL